MSAAPPPARRGAFILFEGVDRCGKSTQCKKLLEWIKGAGYNAVPMRFPNRETVIGKQLNSFLTSAANFSDKVVHLLFSANRWEDEDTIHKTLNSGTHIVMDRYAYSGVAYSAAKGLNIEWCKGPDRGLPAPDLVFYLSLSPEEAAKRGEYGEERYEKVDFQNKIRDVYEKHLIDRSWVVLDARQSAESLHEEVKAHVAKLLNSPLPPVKPLSF